MTENRLGRSFVAVVRALKCQLTTLSARATADLSNITYCNNPTIHCSCANIHSSQVTFAFVRIDLRIGQVFVPDQFRSFRRDIIFVKTRHIFYEFWISHYTFGWTPIIVNHFISSSRSVLNTLRFDIFQDTNNLEY